MKGTLFFSAEGQGLIREALQIAGIEYTELGKKIAAFPCREEEEPYWKECARLLWGKAEKCHTIIREIEELASETAKGE